LFLPALSSHLCVSSTLLVKKKARIVMKVFLVFALIATLLPSPGCSETEAERMAARWKRGYQWPPLASDFKPSTPGWRKLYQHRLRQVEEIEDEKDRFEAFVQTLSAGLVQPNFTEYGFGLARAPDDLMEALRQGIYDGLAKGKQKLAIL
jgi:hypothetical protein